MHIQIRIRTLANLQNILASLNLTKFPSTLSQNLERMNQHFGMQRTFTSKWHAPVSFSSDSYRVKESKNRIGSLDFRRSQSILVSHSSNLRGGDICHRSNNPFRYQSLSMPPAPNYSLHNRGLDANRIQRYPALCTIKWLSRKRQNLKTSARTIRDGYEGSSYTRLIYMLPSRCLPAENLSQMCQHTELYMSSHRQVALHHAHVFHFVELLAIAQLCSPRGALDPQSAGVQQATNRLTYEIYCDI